MNGTVYYDVYTWCGFGWIYQSIHVWPQRGILTRESHRPEFSSAANHQGNEFKNPNGSSQHKHPFFYGTPVAYILASRRQRFKRTRVWFHLLTPRRFRSRPSGLQRFRIKYIYRKGGGKKILVSYASRKQYCTPLQPPPGATWLVSPDLLTRLLRVCCYELKMPVCSCPNETWLDFWKRSMGEITERPSFLR